MFGLFFVLLVLILMLAGKPLWAVKLPGDFVIRRGAMQIYVPLGTSLVLSLLLNFVVHYLRS
jgi:hypothetical protein